MSVILFIGRPTIIASVDTAISTGKFLPVFAIEIYRDGTTGERERERELGEVIAKIDSDRTKAAPRRKGQI